MANLIKNKYILTIATVVIFGLTIALGSLYAKDRIERNDLLTESDAVKFAYVDAGISPKTAPSYEAKLLKEDGIYVYKVVISSEDTRYKYTIAANNGEVISSESAGIAQNKKILSTLALCGLIITNGATSSVLAADKIISQSTAVSAAYRKAGVTKSQVSALEVDYDDED